MNPLLLTILIILPFLSQAQPTVKGLSLPDHPRLLWLAGEEAKIKQQIGRSEEWSRLHQGILAESDSMMALPVLERIQTGRRLLSVSRECLRRVLFWSYSWRMTQEQRYLQRALRELLAVSAFSDWNPSHFLDVAEMTTAVAIGYDWLYHGLAEPDRATIRQALWEKGIAPSLLPENNYWLRNTNNWNQVCNAGMTLGAMAVFEHHPEQAAELVDRAIASLPISMKEYEPDGAYPEGYNYWGYGTTFNVLMIGALEKGYGHDFGLVQQPGFLQSASYMLHVIGPSGQPFNYGDAGQNGGQIQPALYWFADRLKAYNLLWHEKKYLSPDFMPENLQERTLPFALIWGAEVPLEQVSTPAENYWAGMGPNPVALMRTSWTDPNATFVGIKGGTPAISHGHMDVGSFVMEANGVRWAIDFGMQDYESLESKGIQLWGRAQDAQRWQIFRYNNLAHNTLAVNGKHQRVNGFGVLQSGSSPHVATVEMTELCQPDLKKAFRQIAITKGGTVVVTDQVAAGEQPATLRWTMATPATVTLTGRRTALLEKDGRQLKVKVRARKATLRTWSAEPTTDYDAPNPGTVLFGFEMPLSPARPQKLVVVLRPGR